MTWIWSFASVDLARLALNEGLDLVKLSCASGFEFWRIVEFECQVADEGGRRGGSVDFALKEEQKVREVGG